MLLCDDFKAPEETIDAALDALAEIPARRRIVVLGNVDEPTGPQRRIYRRLGQRIGRCAARAVFVTKDEHSSSSRAGAREGGLPAEAIRSVRSVHAALDELRDIAAGDVVLLKGRHVQRFQRIALALAGRRGALRSGVLQCAPDGVPAVSDAGARLDWGVDR